MGRINDIFKNKKKLVDISTTIILVILGLLITYLFNKILGLITIGFGLLVSYKEVYSIINFINDAIRDSFGGGKESTGQHVEKSNDVTQIKTGDIHAPFTMYNVHDGTKENQTKQEESSKVEKIKIYNKLNSILNRARNRHLSNDGVDLLTTEIKEIRNIFEDNKHIITTEIYDLWNAVVKNPDNEDFFRAIDFSKGSDLFPLQIDNKLMESIEKELKKLSSNA